jgi:hypothetical protein
MPKRRRDDAPPVCRNPSLTPNAVVTVINDGPRLTRSAGPLLGTHMSPSYLARICPRASRFTNSR